MNRKNLYKSCDLNRIEKNRERTRLNRALQRTNNFSQARNISPVPVVYSASNKKAINKENRNFAAKTDAYMQRFLKYKENMKKQKIDQQVAICKKPPFIVVGTNANRICVPNNYKFQPKLKFTQPIPQFCADIQKLQKLPCTTGTGTSKSCISRSIKKDISNKCTVAKPVISSSSGSGMVTRAAARKAHNAHNAPVTNSGAIGKVRSSVASKKVQTNKGTIKHTVQMKPSKSNKAGALKCGPAKLALIKEMITEPGIPKTPFTAQTSSNEKPFLTSTEIKPAKANSAIIDLSNVEKCLSPVEMEITAVTAPILELNAKRALQLNEKTYEDVTVNHSGLTAKRRFNFKRVLNTTIETPIKEKCSLKDVADTKALSSPTEANNLSKAPPMYISPSITISRGRVSVKHEKRLHDRFYETAATTTNYSVEQQRTLATANYYRQQLNDETVRMHRMCDTWQTYKDANLAKLEELAADDAINVTIGQTKLLTSKKFMQFSGLIERCIAGVTGVGAPIDDGSENTKLINAVDLEGFWHMLKLQVDNVDKRFENLERLKLRDWKETDEPECNKTNLPNKKTKISNSKNPPIRKGKANSAVLEMVRKAKENFRKAKLITEKNTFISMETDTTSTNALNVTSDETKVKTPIPRWRERLRQRNSQSPTPGRVAVVVRDRRSFSAAPTIINIPTLTAIKVESPKLQTPRNIAPRKSILKTPGTATSARKSVNFNKFMQVRKFKFTIARQSSESDEN